MMISSDEILDFGPGAGEHGGQIIAQGNPKQIMANTQSLTGKYLSGKKRVEVLSSQFSVLGNYVKPEQLTDNKLTIVGAREHNLKNITVEFPLGKFICITGVSGSGKSTLIHDILYNALAERFYRSRTKPGDFDYLSGFEHLDKVILIDQSPIGRTPRSNPATYTGVFTPIRELFAATSEAKLRGYQPGRFSFNVKGGRCENCAGDGVIKIEMHYKGKTIAEVLEMTCEQALEFFASIPAIARKLQTLVDVGLGYITLGQPANTLSGGEAQRVKLATELSRRPTGRTLYILDEPTTGLHIADVDKLLNVLHALVDAGNSMVVIEHNLDVIKSADYLIDMGPEGGAAGGKIVAQGTPEQVAKSKSSYTGQYLTHML